MKYETLPKKVLFLWECAAIICIAVIMVITLIIFQPHTIVWYLLLWSIGAVAVFFIFISSPCFCQHQICDFNRTGHIAKRGYLSQSSLFKTRDHQFYFRL